MNHNENKLKNKNYEKSRKSFENLVKNFEMFA